VAVLAIGMAKRRLPRPAPGNSRTALSSAPPAHAWLAILAILVAGAATYLPSLSYPFVFDDKATIVDNASIRDLFSLGVLAPRREVPTAGRPLVNVTHAVNYVVGGIEPSGYRAINLGIHLACGVLAFALIHRTLRAAAAPESVRNHALLIAFAAALFWTVHPLNSEVVEYITQRSESMMAFFLLAMLYASRRALDANSRAWSSAAVLACGLGMACKESMAIAPLAAWLYDRTFIFESWTGALRARWRLYSAFTSTWLLLAALIWSGPRAYSAGFATAVSPWLYLLNQAREIPHYLRLAAWPSGLVVAYGPPLSLALSSVWLPGLIMCILIAATIIAMIRWPLVGFSGAWLLLTLAPTSSFLPIATEVGAERRMYLALLPLSVLFAVGVQALADRLTSRHSERTAMLAIAVVAAILAITTSARTHEYASPLVLARTVLERRPTPFAHAVVGTQLAIEGRHDEAIAHFRIAAPEYNLAHYHLGGELFNQGRLDAALPELRAFVEAEPWRAEAVPARTMIGRSLMALRRWTEADAELRRVMTMAPKQTEMWATAAGFLADSFFAQERFDEAAAGYREFLELRPRDVGATINLGVALAQSGHQHEAADAFRRVLQLDPSNATARRNLGIVLEDLRR
jgi:Flp pilus assembly protein TadD